MARTTARMARRIGPTLATSFTAAIALLVLISIASPSYGNDKERDQQSKYPHWPQFRGLHARGISNGWSLPTSWDGTSGVNIKWKTPIPGLGHSSPVIWGDKVFVTTCLSGKKDPELRVGLYGDIQPVEDDSSHTWRVYCLNKKTGKVMWDVTSHVGVPAIKRHPKATHANCTPATDGKHVIALFGSEGLYCYDMAGKLLWKKDLGQLDAGYWVVPTAQWEFGSSPVIHNGKVIVQCDVQKNPFLAAFDIKTGNEIWRTPREDVCTWSTPTVHESVNRTEVIINGFRHIGGYDVNTGKELWKMGGGADIPVPTPFVADDLIFITSSHQGPVPLYAIKVGASGDISLKDDKLSSEYVAWYRPRRGTYMQTPIVVENLLFTCSNSGIVTCYDAATGDQFFRKRIDRGIGFTASPVAGDGKIYFSSETGEVHVLEATTQRVIAAVNPMGEPLMATPAISEGNIFIRGQHHLFCVGK